MKTKSKPLRAKQLAFASWTNDAGRTTYSTFVLGTDGGVYRYDPHCEGWIPWPMRIVDCRTEHKARR